MQNIRIFEIVREEHCLGPLPEIKPWRCGAQWEISQLAWYTRLDSPKEPAEAHVIKKLLQLCTVNWDNLTLLGLDNVL